MDDTAKVLSTEFSPAFVDGMKSRMLVSFYKYGPVADAFPAKVNALETLQRMLDKYRDTGNTEYLIDAGNYCMIEFMHPSHPDAHFRATDSKESAGRAAYDTNFSGTQKSNAELTDSEWRELQELQAKG